ncbi:carbon storage regulator [Pseudomonas fluorescens]|uniref:carbon storage regulator n=1 Tax=Pseudomonas fluorescens TaxID=294 RepID=UPI00192AC00E|nr:carbon storage regulator [Pseudomonas fluorescens]
MEIINLNVGDTCHLSFETKLRVLATRGNSVQLGFEAPKDVHIYRSELILSPDKRRDQAGKRRG